MTYENIRFPKEHFALVDGYFYFVDEVANVLYKKVSDGSVAFTYPIIETIGPKIVNCLDFDGRYFWTLQQGTTTQDVVIKKWYLENYVCKLKDTLYLTNNVDHSFSSISFSLECYNTTLSEDLLTNAVSINLTNYYTKVTPGTIITIGPNDAGQYEDVTVTGTIDEGTLGLNFFVKYDYDLGTPVYFNKNIWLINKYTYKVLTGSIYKISLPQKEIVQVIASPDYTSITASCFYTDGEDAYILLAIGTNLRFLNLDTLVVEKTMTMDNIKINQSTLIPVKAMQIEEETLYRLQTAATYFGVDYSFTTKNYQPSPLRSFVDSVSVDAMPKILPSNGINVAKITAVVNDQYSHPAQNKAVRFYDSDDVGYMTTSETYTGLNGTAISYYKAGIVPKTVVILALATQYN